MTINVFVFTCKIKSVEDSINKSEPLYSKPNFVYVVKEGLNLNLAVSMDFTQMRHEINKAYNEVWK